MGSLTVEVALQAVAGTRQDVERARAARGMDEWKADMQIKELDNLAVILKLLRSSTDTATRQAILKQIVCRINDIRAPFADDQKDPPNRGSAAVVGGIVRGFGNDTAKDRLQRAQSDRRIKQEQEAEARAQRLQREREEKERVLLQRRREATASPGRSEERTPISSVESASRGGQDEVKRQFVITKPRSDDGNLGLTAGSNKDRQHLEWDAEIRSPLTRLNGVVNEKVQHMNDRKSPGPTRYSAATTVAVPRPRAAPSASQSAPQLPRFGSPAGSPTASTTHRAKDPEPQRAAVGAAPVVRSHTPPSALRGEKPPLAKSLPAVTTTNRAASPGSGDKVAELMQQAGKDAAVVAQLLRSEEDDFLALNGAIRALILGFNSCTECLTRSTEAELRQAILDLCMAVLAAAKEYFTDPKPANKAALSKEVVRAQVLVKDYHG